MRVHSRIEPYYSFDWGRPKKKKGELTQRQKVSEFLKKGRFKKKVLPVEESYHTGKAR